MNLPDLLLLLRRIAAFLYDSLLLLSLFFMFTGIAVFFNQGQAIESVFYRIVLLPVAGVFYCWFWKRGGQTLGMRAWRIKLVNNDSQILTWEKCIVRFITGLMLFGVTYVYALFDKQGRTLHDRLTHTHIKRGNSFIN